MVTDALLLLDHMCLWHQLQDSTRITLFFHKWLTDY